MKTLFLFFLIMLAAIVSLASSPQNLPQNKITQAEAKALVIAALTPTQRQLPGLEAELGEAAAEPGEVKGPSRLWFIMVVWEGLPEGSVMVGNYEVDPYTGDVFSATMECKEEKNRRLKALQKKVRAELHLSQSEYRRIKTKGPLCEED